ncbi:MAG: UvrD-helicase domain-containing protein, partial [Rickettsiales bacterium]
MQPLNSPQKEAVETTEGPLLVLAGAGTGKTKVLTSRIAYIISNNLAYPSQILAVTFSNKAAKEMQNRINDITASDGLNIGTFHSISTRILRSHIHLIDNGMSQNFNIVDQDEQIKLVKNIALENNIDIKKYPPKLL